MVMSTHDTSKDGQETAQCHKIKLILRIRRIRGLVFHTHYKLFAVSSTITVALYSFK